ncbi:fibronectin type III domain-containing protein [Veillonella parvula]|uniref:fibronectin type III domain-containing protein n=1 Tax=Veillonella parvula TaxID=29466 RepID=UPI0039A019AA
MWQSDSSEVDAVIEYRLVGSDTTQTIRATDKAFTDDGSTTYIHEGTVTGLTPILNTNIALVMAMIVAVIGIR